MAVENMQEYLAQMWKIDLNKELLDFYIKESKKLQVSENVMEGLSAPLLVHANPYYASNKSKRVIIVGKETAGWGDGNIKTYKNFISYKNDTPEESVREMMNLQAGYIVTGKKSCYKFWQMYKLIAKCSYQNLIDSPFLWMDLVPVDYHCHSYLGYGRGLVYDKMPCEDIPELLKYTRQMLLGSISILKPKVIVFCTGNTYEHILQDSFGAEYATAISLRSLPECSCPSEEKIDATQTKTFLWNGIRCIRTQHPRALEKNGAKSVKKIIADTVHNLIV